MNRNRLLLRQGFSTYIGVGAANNTIDPGLDFYRAISDGEGQARLFKAKVDLARNNQ